MLMIVWLMMVIGEVGCGGVWLMIFVGMVGWVVLFDIV